MTTIAIDDYAAHNLTQNGWVEGKDFYRDPSEFDIDGCKITARDYAMYEHMADKSDYYQYSLNYDRWVELSPWVHMNGLNILFGDESDYHGVNENHYAVEISDPFKTFRDTKPVQVVADFYLLDAIASGVLVGKPKPLSYNWQTLAKVFKLPPNPDIAGVDRVQVDALRMLTEHVNRYSEIFTRYAIFAIGTEIQFHYKFDSIAGQKDVHHSVWLARELSRLFPDRAGAWFARLFRYDQGSHWSGGYGREPWAICADVLHMQLTGDCEGMRFSEREFLDRVFSLQHNGGTFLNKVDWSTTNGQYFNEDHLKATLNAHHESDWATLLNEASEEVAFIFGRNAVHIRSGGKFVVTPQTKKGYEYEKMKEKLK